MSQNDVNQPTFQLTLRCFSNSSLLNSASRWNKLHIYQHISLLPGHICFYFSPIFQEMGMKK